MKAIRILFFGLIIVAIFVLSACGGVVPSVTPAPMVERTEEPTIVVLPTATSVPLNVSPIGKIEVEQTVFSANPGDTFSDVITLTSTDADQFAFPGYICSTDQLPYGVGNVMTQSGGLVAGDIRTYGVQIWPDAPNGTCTDKLRAWLYKGGEKYEVYVNVTITITK